MHKLSPQFQEKIRLLYPDTEYEITESDHLDGHCARLVCPESDFEIYLYEKDTHYICFVDTGEVAYRGGARRLETAISYAYHSLMTVGA